jgi:hypothetical protein
MKKNLLFIILVLFIAGSVAQTTDYLPKKDFQTEKNKIYTNLNSAKKAAFEVKKLINTQNVKIDSLSALISLFSAKNAIVTDLNNQMSQKIATMEEKVNSTNSKLASNLLIALLITGVAFIVLLVIFWLQWKKAMTGYKSIHDEYLNLNEKVEKEIQGIRNELKECLNQINTSSRNLDLRISTGLDEIGLKHESLNKKVVENEMIMQDQLKKTCEDYENKLKGIKAEFDAKREEILSQVDKNFQNISSELKKIKLS